MVRLMKNEWFVRELGDGTLSLVAGIQNRAKMQMHKTRQWIMFHGLTRANMGGKRVVDLQRHKHTHSMGTEVSHQGKKSSVTIAQGA